MTTLEENESSGANMSNKKMSRLLIPVSAFPAFAGMTARIFPLAFVFSLLLTAFCLLLLSSSCKDVPVMIEKIEEKIDTTSHDFTWQIDTLGEGSSVLYDVAIIDENNIWAVGEMYLNDSTGQFDPNAYNAARWNGQEWILDRIPTAAFGGSSGFYPINTVFAFSGTDIWTFSAAGSYSHWNGSSWSSAYVSQRSGGGTKLWGVSSGNLYLAGTNGSISHFNGSTWQKLSSGTTLDIQDIWGSMNRLNSQWEILAVARDPFSFDRRILSVSTSGVSVLNDSGITSQIRGIWFQTGSAYYAVGDGIFYKRPNLAVSRWEDAARGVTTYYSNAVRGTNTSNVVMVGAFGDVVHYNGSTWKHYPELNHPAGSWYGVAVKGGLVVAVGDVGVGAAVLIGRQQ